MDYPPINGPKLSTSPYELGISRADLWAFAGILALDEAQRTTRTQCDNYNWDTTCGDNSTTCFTPFPKNTENLFKTGRIDCIPSDNHSEKHQYLASKIEDGPDHSGKCYHTSALLRAKIRFTIKPRWVRFCQS